MKFIVRIASHLDEAETSSDAGSYATPHSMAGGEEYEAANIFDLIDQLLDEWVNGDADMPGAFAFLAENGHDLGITDAEVNESSSVAGSYEPSRYARGAEGTDSDLLQTAADLIRELFGPPEARSMEQLALFLAAISGEYTIEGDVSDKEEGASESDTKAGGADKVEAADAEDEDDEELDEEYEKQLDEDYDY